MMSDSNQNTGGDQNAERKIEIDLSGDTNLNEALETGMGAIKSVMEGFVKMAQDMVGPEGMRNLEAAQWLAQVAASIEEVAEGTRITGKTGELACFLERAEDELKASKFESQLPSFLQRLEEVSQIVDRLSGSGSSTKDDDAKRIADSAGYFRAAAASVAPVGGNDGATASFPME